MKKNSILSVSRVISTIGRPVFFYPIISHCLNNMDAAIFVGNFMYWQGKEAERNHGWIYKSMDEIQLETGLKRRRQENVRKFLKDIHILQTKLAGVPARVHYWFDWDKLDEMISNYVAQKNISMEDVIGDLTGETKTKKKEPKPKEEKPPKAPKDDKPPTILYQMKVIFDEVYDECSETGYEWIPKDWKHLKHLKTALYNRGIARKKKQAAIDNTSEQIIVTDEELLVSWRAFLTALPKSVQDKFFTPAALYGNFNSILKQITDERKKQQSIGGAYDQSAISGIPSDYVQGV